MGQAQAAVAQIVDMAQTHGWTLHPVVHSSTLLRAWQTAQIVIEGTAEFASLVQTDRLAERGVGSGANLTQAQLEALIAQDPRCDPLPPKWKTDSHFCLPLPGAESLMDSGERVAAYIGRVMDELPDQPGRQVAVLFVGHGGAFRHAAHHMGVLPFDEIPKLSMRHADPIAITRADDRTCKQIAGSWRVRDDRQRHTD